MIKQYPHESETTESKASEMRKFCSRMVYDFYTPNVSIDEIGAVYAVIHKAGIVKNELYGTSSPDLLSRPKLTIQEIK